MVMKNLLVRSILLTLCFTNFLSSKGWTQVSLYSFNQQVGTYSEISGGSALTFSGNDTVFTNLPIGFTYLYNGVNYTSFGLSDNGFIVLGNSAPGLSYNPLSSGSTNNVISGFGFALYKQSNYSLRYQTIGTAPNRTLVIQWKNFKRFTSSTTVTYNFQIRLTETTNTAQVKFGNFVTSTTTASTAEIGLRGNTSADFSNRSVLSGGNWSNSTNGSSNNASCIFNDTHLPSSGLTYTWTPAVCSDPGIVSLSNFTTTSGSISWTAQAPAAYGYEYYYSTSSIPPTNTTVPSGNTMSTSVTLNGLNPNTSYFVWVRSNCGVDYKSNWSQVLEFYTGYCLPTTTIGCSQGDIIAHTKLNTLDSYSGATCESGTSGYLDNSSNISLTTTLTPSNSYELMLRIGQNNGNIAAWIDFNDNLVFENSERIVYSSQSLQGSGSSNTPSQYYSLPFTLDCNANAGSHRLRIKFDPSTNGNAISPCGSMSSGEIEDYTVTIAAIPSCLATGFIVTPTNILQTSLDLNFSIGCATASTYDIEYGISGFAHGTGTTLTNQSVVVNGSTGTYSITGLNSNTAYDFYVRANCGGTNSAWSLAYTQTTACDTIYLTTPADITVCDSYTLPVITGSNLTGNQQYYSNSQANNGQMLSGPITSSTTIWIYDSIANCSDETSFNVTVNLTPQLNNPDTVSACVSFDPASFIPTGTNLGTISTLNSDYQLNGGTMVSSFNTDSLLVIYSANGNCSSEEAIQILVYQPTNSSTSITTCDSLVWNGQTYFQSGTYTFLSQNEHGCDSTATLLLTILESTESITQQTSCDSYFWNGQTYNQSGLYSYHTINSVGCDSTAKLDLTIHYSTTSSTSVTNCYAYSWNGITYTQSGTYTYSTSNQYGCDSTATLILTIANDDTLHVFETNCGAFDWNGNTYNQSGTYTYNTSTSNGCDSIVILHLTVNLPNSSLTTVTSCDTYSWNGQTYTSNGTYNFLTTNQFGCDSVATLQLTIKNSPQAFLSESNGTLYTTPLANAQFQWIDCATQQILSGQSSPSFTPTIAGSYAAIITNDCGVDTSDCIAIQVGSIAEFSSRAIEIYPNPFNQTIHISGIEGAEKLELLDNSGRVVKAIQVDETAVELETIAMQSGLYFVRIQFGADYIIRKVIKE